MTKREKKELKKLQQEVGAVYKLDGDETLEDLRACKKEIESENEDPQNETEETEEKEEEEEQKSDGKVYLWLKTRAYISDSERIDPGFYCMAQGEMFSRLENAEVTVCEIFEDKIPSRKLAEIARHCGVNSDNYEKDSDLLKVLLTVGIRKF